MGLIKSSYFCFFHEREEFLSCLLSDLWEKGLYEKNVLTFAKLPWLKIPQYWYNKSTQVFFANTYSIPFDLYFSSISRIYFVFSPKQRLRPLGNWADLDPCHLWSMIGSKSSWKSFPSRSDGNRNKNLLSPIQLNLHQTRVQLLYGDPRSHGQVFRAVFAEQGGLGSILTHSKCCSILGNKVAEKTVKKYFRFMGTQPTKALSLVLCSREINCCRDINTFTGKYLWC